MALTGELSDLSLAELIEFFCNQRKTGRLKVIYSVGSGYFYLKAGAVIHAHFGDLRGIDAVYYALTQNTASFTFNSEFDPPEHSINQPWTSVVLEGLRRMDEGIAPPQPSPASLVQSEKMVTTAPVQAVPAKPSAKPDESGKGRKAPTEDVKAFGVLLSNSEDNEFTQRRRWHPALVIAALVLLIGGVSIPWAVYTRKKVAQQQNEPKPITAPASTPADVTAPDQTQTEVAPETVPSNDTAAELARRQREARARERARLDQEAARAPVATATPATTSKRVTVQVTYDENGRVTAASGGDPTALRIARQKRFPPGKPGSATITIPIN